MKNRNYSKLVSGAVVAAALAVPLFAQGCSSTLDPGGLCCKEFQVGADLTGLDLGAKADFKGQFTAFAQASGDMAASASAMLTDVGNACKGIALDLGADAAAKTNAEGQGSEGARMQAWCTLAKAQIAASMKANVDGSFKAVFKGPTCQASVNAQTKCEASCSGSASCDVKANPPQCKGGTMSVACKGECTAKADATLHCTGACSAECKGSCTAKGGVAVKCDGKCEGTCAAGASGSTDTGAQADGSCKGTCSGTCTARAEAPSIKCEGTCSGECKGSCTGTAEASAKCDGECKADYEPLSCSGGTLEGGCKASAECSGSCNASASAKAECTPPVIEIQGKAKAGMEAQYTALVETLKVNLPNLIVVAQARGDAFLKVLANFSGQLSGVVSNAGKLEAKGVICGTAVVAAAVNATNNATLSVKASVDVVATVAQ